MNWVGGLPKSRALEDILSGRLLEGIIESFVTDWSKRYILAEDTPKELAKPTNEELAQTSEDKQNKVELRKLKWEISI